MEEMAEEPEAPSTEAEVVSLDQFLARFIIFTLDFGRVINQMINTARFRVNASFRDPIYYILI